MDFRKWNLESIEVVAEVVMGPHGSRKEVILDLQIVPDAAHGQRSSAVAQLLPATTYRRTKIPFQLMYTL
jgi:hypothetical protein